jgi:hypothetical protein
MNRGQRYALLLSLAKEMHRRGSWCGETHIQKGSFLLQEVFDSDAEYEFILYKHGPFSFDLHEDLIGMQADGLLEPVVRDPRYRPTFVSTEAAQEFLKRFPRTIERHKKGIARVAKFLGDKGVAELERLATALFIKKQDDIPDQKSRATELTRIKPHIQFGDALEATREIDDLLVALS